MRPFTCAALVATTPAQWCSPSSGKSPKTYVRLDPIVFDTSFYYNKITETIFAFMPLFVYSILKDGYKLLSSIPGLEDLENAAMEDTQVKYIIKRLGNI